MRAEPSKKNSEKCCEKNCSADAHVDFLCSWMLQVVSLGAAARSVLAAVFMASSTVTHRTVASAAAHRAAAPCMLRAGVNLAWVPMRLSQEMPGTCIGNHAFAVLLQLTFQCLFHGVVFLEGPANRA